jgi:hypothetical protein
VYSVRLVGLSPLGFFVSGGGYLWLGMLAWVAAALVRAIFGIPDAPNERPDMMSLATLIEASGVGKSSVCGQGLKPENGPTKSAVCSAAAAGFLGKP